MPTPRPLSRALIASAVAASLVVGLSGCVYLAIPSGAAAPPSDSGGTGTDASSGYVDWETQHWVVAYYTLDERFGPDNFLEEMWAIERDATRALERAGLGSLDGNENAEFWYSLAFYGDDADAMWAVLEPILKEAPVRLDVVELWPPGEDAEPRIIEFPLPA